MVGPMPLQYVGDLISAWYTRTRGEFLSSYVDPILLGIGVLDVRLLRNPRRKVGTPYLGFEKRAPIGDTPPPLVGAIIPVVARKGKSQRKLLVGRAATSDVVVDDPSVSEAHCSLERRGDTMLVTDLGSTNGTLINGTPVEPSRSQALSSGDILTLGRHSFKFFTAEGLYDYLQLNLGSGR